MIRSLRCANTRVLSDFFGEPAPAAKVIFSRLDFLSKRNGSRHARALRPFRLQIKKSAPRSLTFYAASTYGSPKNITQYLKGKRSVAAQFSLESNYSRLGKKKKVEKREQRHTAASLFNLHFPIKYDILLPAACPKGTSPVGRFLPANLKTRRTLCPKGT